MPIRPTLWWIKTIQLAKLWFLLILISLLTGTGKIIYSQVGNPNPTDDSNYMTHIILEDMMLHLFWNKSAVRQYVMDWLTISWVMKISMNGCASTKKILMMNLFLTKNFCLKSIWCCQVSALVSFFRLPTPKFWWQTFSLGVSPTAQCFFFRKYYE